MIDKKLLDKFYEGTCTPKEVEQVLGWFEKQREGEQNIEDYWHKFQDNQLTNHLSPSRIRLPSDASSSFGNNQWVKVAAILAIAFSLALVWVTYERSSSPIPVAIQIIEKKTVAGQKHQFQLPDGSTVTLNAQSLLSYPEKFDEATREVILIGEGFFDIAENPDQPFIVSALGVNTQALGTSFNVRAYESESQVEVVLTTGKIRVDFSENGQTAAYLAPGEKVVADTDEQSLLKSEADLAYATGWKDNILRFRETKADEVFARLERWYGVKISSLELSNRDDWQFTGEFRNESLENVLTSIGYAKNFQFQIQQKSVTITY
ncbi:MAG: FecR domain-containing protein [Bacteroidota bacterium]